MSLANTVFNRCPACGEGKVFKTVYRMNELCSHCSLKYEKEPGYFLGAMSLSYSMGFVIVLPIFFYLFFNGYELSTSVLIPGAIVFCLSPLLFRYSRLIWLGITHTIESKSDKRNY